VSIPLTREAEVAADWEMSIDQFRLLRRRHKWAHVEFSRQDIRYTDAQIEQIVADMTRTGATRSRSREAEGSGLTDRSARRAS
jgi:hypothetical protein